MIQEAQLSNGTLLPLSEARPRSLNAFVAGQSPVFGQNKKGEDNMDNTENETPPSSPFVPNVADTNNDTEDATITKTRLSAKSPIDREHTSPLKMLKSRASPQKDADAIRSHRKISAPEKRFPVKPASPEPNRPAPIELSIDDVLRDNEGLTKAIQILEDEDSEIRGDGMDDTLTGLGIEGEGDESTSVDDTFVSTFSTFSAVPDMTAFAKVGQTPSRLGNTSRRTQIETPAAARLPGGRPSSTPRAQTYRSGREEGNTTNLILDFTDQINGFSGYSHPSPARPSRHSPLKSMPDMSWAATPNANRNTISNLLDFDIPPAPTPRSMPSITPRELESLKSNFLSEISSLKASLSGKEAEVQALKTAVGDAEKRVGESLEQVREERSYREQLSIEKEDWEKRGREMEAVLRNVKEEIVHGERERDELEGRLDESEQRREAAEMMAQETERKMAAMRAGKLSSQTESAEPIRSPTEGECGNCGPKAVELAVEKVSRELHALYKEKHETKVAALKKSYEKRWEKKIRELEEQVAELSKENEDLKRDLTMTRLEPRGVLEPSVDMEQLAATETRARELEAEVEGLHQIVNSVKQDNAELRKMLDEERVEKGKLVQAVDEMMPLVAAFDEMISNMDSLPESLSNPSSTPRSPTPQKQENLRGSVSRTSGLRAPTSVTKNLAGGSRIAGPPGHDRTKSLQGSSRPGSGLGYSSRSGIMSSIERMGSHKGRTE